MEGQVFSGKKAKAVSLAASVLAADFGAMRECCLAAEAAGADMLHFDVMDGHFVPVITFGPSMVAAVRKACGIPIDVHLMVEQPERFIPEFADAGADVITIHQEASSHVYRDLESIKKLGVKASVALNPGTPLCAVEELIGCLDMILCMTVEPGYGGQAFLRFVLDKVRRAAALARERRPGLDIEVDGGIDDRSAALAAAAGATVLVAGTAVVGRPDLKEAVAKLRASAAAGHHR